MRQAGHACCNGVALQRVGGTEEVASGDRLDWLECELEAPTCNLPCHPFCPRAARCPARWCRSVGVIALPSPLLETPIRLQYLPSALPPPAPRFFPLAARCLPRWCRSTRRCCPPWRWTQCSRSWTRRGQTCECVRGRSVDAPRWGSLRDGRTTLLYDHGTLTRLAPLGVRSGTGKQLQPARQRAGTRILGPWDIAYPPEVGLRDIPYRYASARTVCALMCINPLSWFCGINVGPDGVVALGALLPLYVHAGPARQATDIAPL